MLVRDQGSSSPPNLGCLPTNKMYKTTPEHTILQKGHTPTPTFNPISCFSTKNNENNAPLFLQNSDQLRTLGNCAILPSNQSQCVARLHLIMKIHSMQRLRNMPQHCVFSLIYRWSTLFFRLNEVATKLRNYRPVMHRKLLFVLSCALQLSSCSSSLECIFQFRRKKICSLARPRF